MKPFPKLSAQDRILIVAPHPDDEAIATGALIQRAVATRSKLRVVFATDGENNPWPQRVFERKWNISPEDRARWGARRRREAVEALALLGVPGNSVRFLGLPDQGITGLLLSSDNRPLTALAAVMREWHPTLVVIPSPADVHPDHNSLYVYAQLAFDHARLDRNAVTELRFIVHDGGRAADHRRVTIDLEPIETAKKRDAILCHKSQMALSRKRFLAHANDTEVFYGTQPVLEMRSGHPIRRVYLENGALKLHIHLPKARRPFKKPTLFIAIESSVAGAVRWAIPLPSTSRRVRIHDAGTDEVSRIATVRFHHNEAKVTVPIAALSPIERLFAKLDSRLLFLDLAGWCEVRVGRASGKRTIKAAARLPVPPPAKE